MGSFITLSHERAPLSRHTDRVAVGPREGVNEVRVEEGGCEGVIEAVGPQDCGPDINYIRFGVFIDSILSWCWFKFFYFRPQHTSARGGRDDAVDDHAVPGNSGRQGDGVDDGAVGDAIDIQHVPSDVFEGQTDVDALGVGADVARYAAAVEEALR